MYFLSIVSELVNSSINESKLRFKLDDLFVIQDVYHYVAVAEIRAEFEGPVTFPSTSNLSRKLVPFLPQTCRCYKELHSEVTSTVPVWYRRYMPHNRDTCLPLLLSHTWYKKIWRNFLCLACSHSRKLK